MPRHDRPFASLALLAVALAGPVVLAGCSRLKPAGAITIRLQGHGNGVVEVYGSGSGSFANALHIKTCYLSSNIYHPEERECSVYLGDSLNAGDFIHLQSRGSDPYIHLTFQEPGLPAVMRGGSHVIRATAEPHLVGVTYMASVQVGTHMVRVGRTGAGGSGLIKSTPQGILCRLEAGGLDSGFCLMELPAGTRVELTAEPDLNAEVTGYNIAGFYDGAGISRSRCAGPTCAFTVDDDLRIDAQLATVATLAIDCAGGAGRVVGSAAGIACECSATGSGRGTCRAANLAGRSVTLVAMPSTAAPFEGWTVSNAPGLCPASAGTSCALTVPEGSTTVSAKFGPKRQPVLRIEGAGGAGRVTVGMTGLDCVLSGAGPGTGTCAVSLSASYGIVYAGFAPAAGFLFESLTGLEGLGGNCLTEYCSFILPMDDTTLRVKFRPADWPRLSIAPGGGDGLVTGASRGIACALAGTGSSGACGAWVEPGAPVTLAALSATGFAFSSWSFLPADLATSCIGSSCSYTPAVGVPVIATATFVPGASALRRLSVSGTDLLAGEGTVTGDVGGISCTVTGSFGGNGTCGVDLPDGTVVMLSATPAAGSSFNGWSIHPPPAVRCTILDTTCAVTLTADTHVVAGFDGLPRVRLSIEGTTTSGTGRVTGDVGGLDCAVTGSTVSGTCQTAVQVGAPVVLTAIPAAGFTFSGWSFTPADLATSCLGSSCTVTPAAGAQVVATPTFVPIVTTTRHLDVFGSVLLSGGGTVTSDVGGINCTFGGSSVGTGTCGADLPDGTVVTLSATAAAGSSFASWDVQPLQVVPCTAGAKSCAVTLTANTTVTAAFDRLPAVRLVIEGATASGSGTVTSDVGGISCTVSGSTVGTGACEAMVPPGMVVTLTATPAAGSGPASWTGWPAPAGACAPGPTCVVTVTAASTVQVGFDQLPTVRLTVDGGVTGSPGMPGGRVTSDVGGIDCTPYGYRVEGTCTADVAPGTLVTLTAIPSGSYLFESISYSTGQPACTSSPCQVTVSAATTATAAFAAPPPTRTVTITAGGWDTSVTPAAELTTAGEAGTIVATSAGASCDFTTCAAPNAPYLPGAVACRCTPLASATVVLQATPKPGYSFSEWAAGCSTTNGSECTIDPSGIPAFVSATFTKP